MGRGLNCATSLKSNRKRHLRGSKAYFKYFPTITGVVTSILEKEARQPSSGKRTCVRVNTKMGILVAYIPHDHIKTYINVHDTVVIQSIGGKKGRSMGDIPGARFKVIKIGNKATSQIFKGRISVK